ncbi:MAG: ABC transporter ATP-binding protein [Burkholderiaceae bacterium]
MSASAWPAGRQRRHLSPSLAPGSILALCWARTAPANRPQSILFGHYVADSGDVLVNGKPLPPGDPAAALAGGIGMVHQHFALAENLSVLENIIAGTRGLFGLRLRRAQARQKLLQTASRFGLHVDPDLVVGELSMGERQRVEILKALYRGATLLILDEPTAVLTPQESESLFATLAQLVEQGLSIIFISHKLDEVMRVADRIVVLRAGRLVADWPRALADRQLLAETMVGSQVPHVHRDASPLANSAEVVCRLVDVSLLDARRRPRLSRVGFDVHRGEILAIAGVSGNGQQALADVLCGIHAIAQGRFEVDGKPMRADPRALLAAGVARVPEDRHGVGVVGELPVWENAVLEQYRSPRFSYPGWLGGWLRRRRIRAFAAALVQRLDVRGLEDQGLATPTRSLSGGNMQKLILGRALSGNGRSLAEPAPPPVLIVANQPTWGLDVGAVAAIHQQLIDAADAGSAIVLISEDLEEVFAIADTVAVIHAGRLSLPRPTRQWSMAEIGAAMSGMGDAHAA